MKTIKYYKKSVYGRWWNYAADPKDTEVIQKLTGKKTIDSNWMSLISQLTDNSVTFEEVIPTSN